MSELTFVTGNPGKAYSAQRRLTGTATLIHTTMDIEEPYMSVTDNAIHKARVAYKALRKPVIVDDNGLFIPSRQGWPGAHVKRERERLGSLAAFLEAAGAPTQAYWEQTLVYYDGKTQEIFTETIPGMLISPPRPAPHGRPLKSDIQCAFISTGQERTVAELTDEELLRAIPGTRWDQLRTFLEHQHPFIR